MVVRVAACSVRPSAHHDHDASSLVEGVCVRLGLESCLAMGNGPCWTPLTLRAAGLIHITPACRGRGLGVDVDSVDGGAVGGAGVVTRVVEVGAVGGSSCVRRNCRCRPCSRCGTLGCASATRRRSSLAVVWCAFAARCALVRRTACGWLEKALTLELF